jgi:hypothetical protein
LVSFAPQSLAVFLQRLTGNDCSTHIRQLIGDGVAEVFFTHFIQLFADPTTQNLQDAWKSTAALIMPFNCLSVDCVIVVRVRYPRSASVSSSSSSSSVSDDEYWPLWIQVQNYKYLSPQAMTDALHAMSPGVSSMQSASPPPAVPSQQSAAVASASAASDIMDLEIDAPNEDNLFTKRRKVSAKSTPRKRCIRLVVSVRDQKFESSSVTESLKDVDFLSLRVRGMPECLPERLRKALRSLCDDSGIPSAEMRQSKSSCVELKSCYSKQGLSEIEPMPNRDHDFSERPRSLPL